jgi:DNA-binding NtrC family response regulator
VDFRLVAATNRSLEAEVKEGKFREDLYFRLNVLRLHLPSLRERPSDIPPLVEHFVRMYNDRLLTEIEGVSDDALNLLMRQSWKGNIRELENFIQGLMVIVGEGMIGMHHVHERLSQRIGFEEEATETASAPLVNAALDFPDTGLDLNERLEQVETQLLSEALRRADGNKTKAARLLGLNRTTLVEKLKRKGMV